MEIIILVMATANDLGLVFILVPEQTHECSDWQSADWNSSDQVRKTTAWQSHFLWP